MSLPVTSGTPMTIHVTQLDFLAALEAPMEQSSDFPLPEAEPSPNSSFAALDREAAAAPLAVEPEASAASAPANLQEVIDRLLAVEPAPPALAERVSALRMLGKILEKSLVAIPAAPRPLGALIDAASPMLAGVLPQRWRNIRSLVRTSLRMAGVEVMAGRHDQHLSPKWHELAEHLPTRRMRIGLSRLISYLSAHAIEPGDVDATVLGEFQVAFLDTSIGRGPTARFNTLVRIWNEAVQADIGWPTEPMTLIADERRYALAWGDLPASFAADTAAYLDRSCDPDPFATHSLKPLRPETVKQRRALLQRLASALLETGFKAENLTGLAVLAEPENAKTALRHLMIRSGGKPLPTHAAMAYTLLLIAKQWVKAPPAQVDELRRMTATLRTPQRGITAKNRGRLRQLDVAGNVHALLNMPRRVATSARSHDDGERQTAVRLMRALAIEILLVAPMRIRNLVELEVDRHLVRIRRGKEVQWRIVIPPEEVKNGVPIEAPLPPETVALLTVYMDRYRARVCDAAGLYLFPGDAGGSRNPSSFGESLKKFVRRETGLLINVHLFRHVAGKLYLASNPSGIEVVRRMLGHTNSSTTLKAYAELQADAAFADYDRTLGALRDGRDTRLRRVDRLQLSPAASGKRGGRY